MGVQLGLDVHVLDLNERGPKPGLVADLGATFHTGTVGGLGLEPDVVIECTGHGPLVLEVTRAAGPDAVVCLAGIAAGGKRTEAPLDEINRELVLENTVVFGTVNASRRDFERAAAALAKADRGWLGRRATEQILDAVAGASKSYIIPIDLVGNWWQGRPMPTGPPLWSRLHVDFGRQASDLCQRA